MPVWNNSIFVFYDFSGCFFLCAVTVEDDGVEHVLFWKGILKGKYSAV